MIDLSIVIVSYRAWDKLRRCLESLGSFEGKNFTFEVIVVDNNSGDGEISSIENQFRTVKIIKNDVNGGFAYGCNIGSKSARGNYLLFLNPDTVSTETEIRKLLNSSMEFPEYSIVSCRQVNAKGKTMNASGDFPALINLTGIQRSILGLLQTSKKSEPSVRSVIYPDWVSGSVMLIRKELFIQVNGFYEGYWMYFEDVDLCKRVSDSGGKIAFFGNITIQHDHGGSSRINRKTTSITKTEVMVSKHMYISRHLKGSEKNLAHLFLVVSNLISGSLISIASLLFFFLPGISARTCIFPRLIIYYTGSIIRKSWMSQRSILNLKGYVKKY